MKRALAALAGAGLLLVAHGPTGAAAPRATEAGRQAASAAHSPSSRGLLERMASDSARAAGMVQRQQMDSAHAALAPGIAAARASGDASLLGRWLRLDAMLDVQHGDGRGAVARAVKARRLAEASQDTLLLMFVLRTEAMGRNLMGEYPAGRALAERWMDLARRSGNDEYLAWGRAMLGWLDEHAGSLESARAHYEWALERFTAIGHDLGEGFAANQVGNIHVALGNYAAARASYARALPLARRQANRVLEARLLSNLGVVEIRLGDLATGLGLYRESERIHAEIGNNLDRVISLDNIAVVLQELGRADEACRVVEQAMEIVRRTGLDLEVPWQHEALGHSYWEAGRRAAAVENWSAVLAFGEDAPVPARAGALLGLVTAYVEMDSLEVALAMLDATPERLLTGAEATVRARLALLRAEILERLGRPGEALAIAAPLAADLERRGDAQYGLVAWARVARLERRLQRRERARAALERAADAWWEARARSADPEVREVRGELGRELMAEAAELELERPAARDDPAAIGRAFDRAQRFKTRTLLERIAGPGGGAGTSSWEEIPTATVETLQRRTLAPGELLVEAVVGRDSSWFFAISRDAVRALRLPGERALREAAGLARDLFAAPPRAAADRRAAEAAAERLGAVLLGGLGDLLGQARTLFVAPDGPLHQVPFQALVLPGREAPLLETHRVVIVPSATLLATLRARAPDETAAGPLFAYASEAEPEAPRLRAAADEVKSLGERFRHVVVRILSPRSTDSLGVTQLAGFGALHFAGHIRADDQAPWRSGLAAAWPRSEDHRAMLTAGDIAAHRLGARLVVLSGCESARGRIRTGEGVTGLTSAFLAAGVPTVVATLWPVDDRTTGRLMAAFYERLARGDDAASALATAAARLREDPATAHPFFWAGYVLVGEAGTRLALERRPFSAPGVLRWASLLALATLVPAAWRGWRASGRRAA